MSGGFANMEITVQVGLRTRRVIKLSNVKTVGRKENPRLEILEKEKVS